MFASQSLSYIAGWPASWLRRWTINDRRPRRQLEEPLIFQGEIRQDVSRADAKHQGKKEDAFSNNAHGQEHRHETESVNARTEHGKESCTPN